MRVQHLLATTILSLLLASSNVARAEGEATLSDTARVVAPAEDPSRSAPADAPVQLHAEFSSGVSSLGLEVGGLALLRVGVFELGPVAHATGFFASKVGGGGLLGVGGHGRDSGSLGWDLLAEAGEHVHHTPPKLFSKDPGGSGTIPYAGLRAGLSWSFGGPDRHVRGRQGLWLYGNVDLASSTVEYTYSETSTWSGGGGGPTDGRAKVGGGMLFGLSYSIGLDAS